MKIIHGEDNKFKIQGEAFDTCDDAIKTLEDLVKTTSIGRFTLQECIQFLGAQVSILIALTRAQQKEIKSLRKVIIENGLALLNEEE
jgi:hypothetical protein